MNRIFITVLFIFILSSSCNYNSGKRPYDYPIAKWISEDPKIWFDGVYNPNGYGYDGYLILNDQSIAISVFFDLGSSVYISSIVDDTIIISGPCIFRSDKLTVKIKGDKVLGGKYKRITFIRM